MKNKNYYSKILWKDGDCMNNMDTIKKMANIENLDELFDTFLYPEDIDKEIMEAKEETKVNTLLAKLNVYRNNVEELTKLLTDVLKSDDVAALILRLSQNSIFCELFPEFYVKNEYGENLFNCQQNSPYHRYDLLKHILTTIENVGISSEVAFDEIQIKVLKWTMFLHDIGKPYVKVIAEDGTESFAGHDDKSVELAKGILDRLYFNEEEKGLILKLIKYHDRFLNEGEITEDNMKFLASELDNNRDVFYMLLNVKDADARAKCIDVYNTFKMTKAKYMDFIDKYFRYNELNDNEKIGVNNNNQSNNVNNLTNNFEFEKMTDEELNQLLESILTKKTIKSVYQPIIDIEKEKVYAYEVFTRIESKKRVNIMDLFNYAKETGRFERLQQTLLISGLENFERITAKETKRVCVNSDFLSYEKYVNKPRLYDMMNRNNIIIEFQNYGRIPVDKLNESVQKIRKNHGQVSLDKLGVGNFSVNQLDMVDIDFITTDISLVRNLPNDIEKQKKLAELATYCMSRNIKLLVVGVEDAKTLEYVKKARVRYVQGYFFAKPDYKILNINASVAEKLEEINQETIS